MVSKRSKISCDCLTTCEQFVLELFSQSLAGCLTSYHSVARTCGSKNSIDWSREENKSKSSSIKRQDSHNSLAIVAHRAIWCHLGCGVEFNGNAVYLLSIFNCPRPNEALLLRDHWAAATEASSSIWGKLSFPSLQQVNWIQFRASDASVSAITISFSGLNTCRYIYGSVAQLHPLN